MILIIAACTTSENDPPSSAEPNYDLPQNEFMDLSDGGLPLALKVPSGSTFTLDTKWNAAFGRMELSDSYGLNIFVTKDTLSCAAKKEEIEGGIFNISYIIDNDSLIFYKSTLPDGSTPYWHFFASFPLGDSHYVFENNPLVECTENQIEAMTVLVRNMSLLNKESQ